MKPIEHFKPIQGFGTWRIDFDPSAKKWRLCYNVRKRSEQWVTAGHFIAAESAAVAVGERTTGADFWDGLGFARGVNFDIATWITEASEGVQGDASDGSDGSFS